MAAARTMWDRTLKETLSKSSNSKMGDESCTPEQKHLPDGDRREDQVTHPFLEALFASLREDLQMVKRGLSQDLKEVRRIVAETGDRVSTLEDHESNQDEEIEQLQQEVINFSKQQNALQDHAEDLENQSLRNNIRI
ncbi:hypothetical protein NDU88_004891 [Pleurodeles waltl]|uniref:Uncharacterized protein n=1 Tax=Pleurodeles waltl TaxID=8319 RepID=A0AAV7TAP4_PLEWA|nr:hypothetical protein NDU88_004891 [Pleurodeles waltl]